VPPLTPSQRSLRASIAGNTGWANTADPSKRTEPGRKAFLARFEDEVDPERKLPAAERRRRAEYAKRAHMSRLAFLSAKARGRKGAK
jgi:hypothetical protein